MTQGSIKKTSRQNTGKTRDDFIIVNWQDNQQEKILKGGVNVKKGCSVFYEDSRWAREY